MNQSMKNKEGKRKLRSLAEIEAEIKDERNPEKLLGSRKHPKGWRSLSYAERLEFVAGRILAEDRSGITSHREIKETGILSASQEQRRRDHEVFGGYDFDIIPPTEGVFSRVHTRDIRGVRGSGETYVYESEETTYAD